MPKRPIRKKYPLVMKKLAENSIPFKGMNHRRHRTMVKKNDNKLITKKNILEKINKKESNKLIKSF